MRTPRIAILVLFSAASLFLVCRSISSIRRSGPPAAPVTAQKSTFRTLFSLTAPFSLFPPSAAISLTDDNSTFFPARPAAFGPPLPNNGLSGQLWIGSGFSDETLQDGEGEGELGCSDIPGWEDGRSKIPSEQEGASSKLYPVSINAEDHKRDNLPKVPLIDRTPGAKRQSREQSKSVNDGTDDHLHQGLRQTRDSYKDGRTTSGSSHADIQSIQETAEITGKVALLSRGGCGFLEKVKWAQRRGATALIVGDNQKGGPLIQMFARGNVDNVTIPSVFTSRTTAHLLSSLMQPGSFIEDIISENGDPMLKVKHFTKNERNKKAKTASSAGSASKWPGTTSSQENPAPNTKKSGVARRSWFSRLFRWEDSWSTTSDRNRPPSSGQHGGKGGSLSSSNTPSGDDFKIGVQDWRDSDLLETPSQKSTKLANDNSQSSGSWASARKSGKAGNSPSAHAAGPKGGSITPGSGEYVPGVVGSSKAPKSGTPDSSPGTRGGLISKIFGGHDTADDEAAATLNENPQVLTKTSAPIPSVPLGNEGREGLWVTITPTGSASPFFDTLLVLVISPLITLTVVYALLILRVKIRMRRWRAPKSVVDQLPVRTYQTVAPSPTQSSRAQSPRTPSPASSSPTTPLLQGSSRSRPRSLTSTGAPGSDDLLSVDEALREPRSPSVEKNARRVPSQWKKYMGRQVECVVCLEEYEDGVSRVMSLPCGHEFHAECITPWLTTRRRTCPICKSDVVRSLARGSPSSPQYEPFREDRDDSSGEASDSFQNRLPSPNRLDDLERGPSWSQGARQEWQANRSDMWFSALTSRLGGGSSFPTRRDGSGEDRGR